MMELRLYQPQYYELFFRERLLSDPATMAFNRGKEPSEDYHPDTGCIDFPRSHWALWYNFWMEREPETFYAVVADGRTPLGEISWFFDGEAYRVGMILKKEYRGKGYCAPALDLLAQKGWRVENADMTILAQKPKLMPHIPQMRQNLSRVMGVPVTAISVKATTEEGLGFTGTEEGIAAHAVVLIEALDKT
jgi:2-C-methyl-D-erythritol 2,4-cyclodiphosphate synthase